MKIKTLLIVLLAISTGCSNNKDAADAYGNFEATEIIVSSEASGKILQFVPDEGTKISSGELIAAIDTAIPVLQRAEIDASIKSVRTRISSINAQNEIINQQIANIDVNIKRISNMLKDEAATQKQYDDLTGQVAVLNKQIIANSTQKESVLAELGVMESKKATLNEQIRRSLVK